ncbi:glycosyltransferase family 2 protein [Methylomonas sp. YC3]
MKIWVCIPVFNRVEFTLKCLATLRAQTFQDYKIVICDHGSSDGTTAKVNQAYPDVVIINADSSLWWTGAMNRCVEYVLQHAAAGDYLLTQNNDTELLPEYLAEFAEYANKYPHAVLTSVIHDISNGEVVSVGYRQNWLLAQAKAVGFEEDHLEDDPNVIAVSHASGRGTLFPVSIFQRLGLYDERHLPHYAADYDFSHKARRAGYPIYVCKSCRVFSYVAATGMTTVRDKFSIRSFINYCISIRSPSNLKVRWWYGWNNCPKVLFPSYILVDSLRTIGSYFKHFLLTKT